MRSPRLIDGQVNRDDSTDTESRRASLRRRHEPLARRWRGLLRLGARAGSARTPARTVPHLLAQQDRSGPGAVRWPQRGRLARTVLTRSTLAQLYRQFGEADAAGTSPLYERVAVAVSESADALRAIEAAPARKRHPAVILAALHDLALAGRAPALAAAYAAADDEAAAGAAIDTLVRMADSVAAISVSRQARAHETGQGPVLYPAIAEAARRTGANAVGLIDVGCSAGFNLTVDRVGITYSNGQSLGDPLSPVQQSASIAGGRPVPARAMPEVVARVGVDLDPLDVTDANDARWLRACLCPDQPERMARLEAEIALTATAAPVLLHGDTVEVMPDAFACVPADALPVVTTTWALSRLPLESRLRFLHRLDKAAAGRAVAWVSAEGVGVAPAIPTLGDRRASGHSIIGLAVFDQSVLRGEAIGRCWSRGRFLAWLADS